jgi:hypothetical protein
MAQHDYGNPQSPFSGAQLNTTLRNWRDALHTLHRGMSRPSYVQGGMLWVKEVSSTNWELTFHDGADDILVATINPSINTITPAGAATPADLQTRVAKAGDTMTSFLTLHADPTTALHAATKQYVDARAWSESGSLTATGVAVGVTNLPSGIREIIVNFHQVSVTGTQAVVVQLGTSSSGYVFSGYNSSSMRAGGTILECAGSSSGFLLFTNSAAVTMSGFVHLTRFSPQATNVWQAVGMVTFDTSGSLITTTGHVSMSTGPADRVRIACFGSDTFDSGVFNVMWRV